MKSSISLSDFSSEFREELDRLIQLRRDVRLFRTDDVPLEVLEKCLSTFCHAPSVGLSEPWRLVNVSSEKARKAALENFKQANAQALQGYVGEKAKLYSGLKLTGMQEAPVQLAVFCDTGTDKGAGLGAGTMPEMRAYSVVAAVTQFWLAARAEGLGVGWVSILDPEALGRSLNVPECWSLVAYLCVGWPQEGSATPELERAGWESRANTVLMEER